MKNTEILELRETIIEKIEEAKKDIDAMATMYALTNTRIELGQVDEADIKELEAGNKLLIIQGKLASKSIDIYRVAIAELDELIAVLEAEAEEEVEEAEEEVEEAEEEVDAETIREIISELIRLLTR